jgi:hypothetical protein
MEGWKDECGVRPLVVHDPLLPASCLVSDD